MKFVFFEKKKKNAFGLKMGVCIGVNSLLKININFCLCNKNICNGNRNTYKYVFTGIILIFYLKVVIKLKKED